MKTDGHIHTHYCPHGSGEETEQFVIRAIELGFDTITFTEHPPLPESFTNKLPYKQEIKEVLCMKGNELDDYIGDMHQLKKKYSDRIQKSTIFRNIQIGQNTCSMNMESTWMMESCLFIF